MSLLSTILGAAPALASALGGPLAGSAVKFLSNKILGTDNGSEAEIAKAVESWTPEQRLELKKMDNEYNLKLLDQDINVFSLEIKDRDSARLMASTTKNLWPQMGLAIGYNIGFFGILFVMLSNGQHGVEFPVGIKETLIFLLGVMAGELKNINSFWVGSSYGSKEKSDQAFAQVVDSLKPQKLK
jgi:hypothetical protein